MIKFKLASFHRSRLLQVFMFYLFSLLTLSGQGSFRSGTIIVNDSTMMIGKISPALSDGIITSCLFRAGNAGNTVTYTPGDLQGWHLDGGRQFVSGRYISPETSGMFLEILFDGIDDLFHYNDLFGDHYIIVDRSGRLFSLTSGYKKKRSSQPNDESDASGIRAVLRICMADAPALADRINMLEPDRETLIDLLHDYHVLINRSESDIVYELPPPALEIGAGLFVRYSTDLFNADETVDLSGFSFDPAYFPGLGVFITTSFPRISRSLWSTLNLSLAERYVYGFNTTNEDSPQLTLFEELHLHHLLLSGEFLSGYTFGTGRVRPSLFAGMSGQFVISDDSRIDYDLAGENVVVSESFPYDPERIFRFGFTVGTGIEYRLMPAYSLFMNAGYTRFSGDDQVSSIDSFALTAGIIF